MAKENNYKSEIITEFEAWINEEVKFDNEYYYDTVIFFLDELKFDGYNVNEEYSTPFARSMNRLNSLMEVDSIFTFIQSEFENDVSRLISIVIEENKKEGSPINEELVYENAPENFTAYPEEFNMLSKSIVNILNNKLS